MRLKLVRVKRPILCSRCGKGIERGRFVRQIIDRRENLCLSCVGFILSRYSLLKPKFIPPITPNEEKWADFFNRRIRDNLIAGVGKQNSTRAIKPDAL